MEETNSESLNGNAVRWNIWDAPNAFLSVYADGDKFVAEIVAGIMGETFLSVGYSCPNYADLSDLPAEKVFKIAKALDDYWNMEDRRAELDQMLPTLYEMTKIANNEYNRLIFGH